MQAFEEVILKLRAGDIEGAKNAYIVITEKPEKEAELDIEEAKKKIRRSYVRGKTAWRNSKSS